METPRAFLRRFAVKGVLWRYYLDWAVANVPFYLQPSMIFVWTIFFFFFAAPQRRSIMRNLRFVSPKSSTLLNFLRAFRTLQNFAWTIADAANYKVNQTEFRYEIEGTELLDQLGHARGAIVLTAHMGNYDLGASLFAQKFNREISMVRAPEPDVRSAQHLTESVQRTGEGAVKIAYSSDGALLSFDLLNALRQGEIVSIQGDRIIPGVATVEGQMFAQTVRVPIGPFTLAQVAQVAVYPLFIVRAGYRRYKIIVREPIVVLRGGRTREEDITPAVKKWCEVLQETIAQYGEQWFAFGDIFAGNET
ncbi:MAG: lysophospholipid acyltransferase family protein [Verrucomicrobiota bacterium]|nr:lysophospholipid acyltransferase family protein [Verrucomicrobiota bacterium]